jgi:MFS family permease
VSSPRWIQRALLLASVSVTFQNFVAIPAIPAVSHNFGASTQWSAWLLTAFLLVSCVCAPLLGRVADLAGKRRTLIACALAFFLGSVISAAGPSLAVVIAGRAIQGVGGAIIPISFAIVRDAFPAPMVPRAISIQATSLPLGISSALLLAGFADLTSWRFLFALGAVITAAALALVIRHVPETGASDGGQLDWQGGLMLTVGLVALLVTLTNGPDWGWSSSASLALSATAVTSIVAWVFHELRTAAPLVDVRVLGQRPVLVTNTATFLSTGIAITGALIVVPRLLSAPRSAHGFSATTAVVALFMLTWAVPGLAAPTAGQALSRRLGMKWPLVTGCASMAVGLGLAARWSATPAEVVVALALIGFGLPLVTSASAQLTLASVAASQTAVALGMNNVSRQVGGVVGGQVCAAMLAPSVAAAGAVPDLVQFHLAFGLCSGAGVLAMVLSLFAAPRRAALAGRVTQLRRRQLSGCPTTIDEDRGSGDHGCVS